MRVRATTAVVVGIATTMAGALYSGDETALSQEAVTYPHTDPGNEGNWVMREDLSDEFNGVGLDSTKWWDVWNTWSPFWRWHQDNVSVADGTLGLTTKYAPSDTVSVNLDSEGRWKKISPILNTQMAYISTNTHRTGESALVHYFRQPYIITTRVRIGALASGTYVFRAWVWSTGGQKQAYMQALDCAGPGTVQRKPIVASSGYVLYEISNVEVSEPSCVLEFHSDAQVSERWLRIDDVEFVAQGSSTNLVPNPGFEERAVTPYGSGIVVSKARLQYGYAEARIRVADVLPGVNTAFWLSRLGFNKWTEIDVVETGQRADLEDPNRITHNNHVFHYFNEIPEQFPAIHGGLAWTAEENPSAAYHIYSVEWDPSTIKWYVDGVLKRTLDNTYWDQDLNVKLSLGVMEPYRSSPTGDGFPTTASIDYVRVWQHG